MPKVVPTHFNIYAENIRDNVASLSCKHEIIGATDLLCKVSHGVTFASGWWHDVKTGEPRDRNMGEMLCLVHSEISEAMEGDRKNKMDEHLPHRKSLEVELADAVIRICDIAAALDMDLGGAIAEKLAYNCKRADHKRENRAADGGKAY